MVALALLRDGEDGGIGVAHGSDDSCSVEGSSSVDDASEAMRNHAVEGANGSTALVFLMVRTVALESLMLVMAVVVLMAATVSMTLLKLRETMQFKVPI